MDQFRFLLSWPCQNRPGRPPTFVYMSWPSLGRPEQGFYLVYLSWPSLGRPGPNFRSRCQAQMSPRPTRGSKNIPIRRIKWCLPHVSFKISWKGKRSALQKFFLPAQRNWVQPILKSYKALYRRVVQWAAWSICFSKLLLN